MTGHQLNEMDSHKTQLIEFRQQISIMKTELSSLETKRQTADAQYEAELQTLQSQIGQFESENDQQSAQITLKNDIIESQKQEIDMLVMCPSSKKRSF